MLRSSVFNARSTVRPTLSLPHPPIPQFPPPLPSPDYNTHCIDSSNQKERRRKREGRGRGGGRRGKVAEIVNSNASNVILPQIPPHWNVPSSLPPSLPPSPPLSSPPTPSPSLPLFPTLLLSSPPSLPPPTTPHHPHPHPQPLSSAESTFTNFFQPPPYFSNPLLRETQRVN